MANSVDPDQTPNSAASDLDLPVCSDLFVPMYRVVTIECVSSVVNYISDQEPTQLNHSCQFVFFNSL